jgi:hypothetical protein
MAHAQIGCTDPLANNFPDANDCTYNAATANASSSTIISPTLNENSGLIFWDNALWTHNDGGNTNDLFQLSLTDFSIVSTVNIPGATNVDWEDIAQDDTYVYIGDFGNNANGNRTDLKIYRVTKASISAGTPVVDIINYSYEDQTDFTPTGGNNTDFDCEALIATDNNLFLFTKEWVSGETTVYALPKTPGTYSATNQGSFNVNGLITGATFVEDKQLVVLSGYTNAPQPFIYLFYDFNGSDFFSGNKRSLSTFLFRPQIEGITTADGFNFFISNEESGGFVQPQIQEVSLLDFLGYETSGNSALFSDPNAWEAGTVPPSSGYAIIAHDLNADQNVSVQNLKVRENSRFGINLNTTLTVQNGLAIDASGTLQLEDNAILDAGNSTILNNGVLYFESNPNGSAQFDQFSGALSGSGQVTIERYIPASNRAFRFLATPLTSSGSIRENWQQNGLNVGDLNYEANVGTHITGQGGAANGFDATQTNNPSLFTFVNTTQMYNPVVNTEDATSILEHNTPYTLFMRGDRSIDLTSNNSLPTATTLRATGNTSAFFTGGPISTALNQTNDGFSLVANPFQAVVDFDLASKTNLKADVIVFNPSLNTNGQFVTLTSNRFINPGQSFWVQNDTDVTDPVGGATIAFEEADKNTSGSNSVTVFSEESILALNLELYNENDLLMDVMQFKFQSGGNNGYGNDDMGKILGTAESLCAVNSNTLLSVERRDLPQDDDLIPLNVFSYQGTAYQFKVALDHWDPAVSIVLVDNFLNTQTEIDPDTPYAFSVDSAIPGSMAIDRFTLTFDTQSLGSEAFLASEAVVLYPNPSTSNAFVSLKMPLDSLGQNAMLELYDVNGKLVVKKEFQNLSSTAVFEVSALPSGLYILKLRVQGKVYSLKLSKI